MKILIISDIHYGEDTNYPAHGGEDYINHFGSQFENYIPKFKTLAQEYDLIINLGDLIAEVNADNDAELYKKALGLLNVGVPVKCVLGNHELRNLSRSQLAQIIGENSPYYSFDINNYHHIVLDSFRNDRTEQCRIDPEQLAWLKEDLKKTNLPTLIYCHYILDDQSLDNNYYFKGKPHRAYIENKAEVRKIFEDSQKVMAVFCGHLHFFHQENINNLEYITVPAFTENDSTHRPQAQCVSVELDGNNIETSIKSLNL
ncbi:MAG TPA: metallophosphoesterase [bacterium]|nr:metallophosphoesterase [bacterium]